MFELSLKTTPVVYFQIYKSQVLVFIKNKDGIGADPQAPGMDKSHPKIFPDTFSNNLLDFMLYLGLKNLEICFKDIFLGVGIWGIFSKPPSRSSPYKYVTTPHLRQSWILAENLSIPPPWAMKKSIQLKW